MNTFCLRARALQLQAHSRTRGTLQSRPLQQTKTIASSMRAHVAGALLPVRNWVDKHPVGGPQHCRPLEGSTNHRQQPRRSPQPLRAAAAAGAFTAAALPPLGTALTVAGCVLAAALSLFLLCAIPTVLAWRRVARAVEVLARVLEAEVPDTAATLRLSGLELADAIEEVSLLGNDLTNGVRASANAVVAMEQGLKQSAQLARIGFEQMLLPNVRTRIPAARDAVEASLQQRAGLKHTAPAVRQMASATKAAASKARVALAAADLAGRARQVQALVRSSAARQQPPQPDGLEM